MGRTPVKLPPKNLQLLVEGQRLKSQIIQCLRDQKVLFHSKAVFRRFTRDVWKKLFERPQNRLLLHLKLHFSKIFLNGVFDAEFLAPKFKLLGANNAIFSTLGATPALSNWDSLGAMREISRLFGHTVIVIPPKDVIILGRRLT